MADAQVDGIIVSGAYELAHEFNHARLARRGQLRRAGHPARVPSRLVAMAARLLPVPDRARYSEEFQGELAELAKAGAGRWQQLAYAARQLTGAVQLRSALAGARRRSVP
jgi:hypothetical protein